MLTVENLKHTIEVACDGRRLLRYRAESPARKPHFDFVALPPDAGERAGENLALAAPHDNVSHLGLFFSPGLIDGHNFWNAETLAARGAPHGDCRVTGAVATEVRDDGSIILRHDVHWHTARGEVLVNEQRCIVVHPPEGHAYRLDWESTLHAAGKPRALTAGENTPACCCLAFRAVRSMTDGTLLSSEGHTDAGRIQAGKGPWVGYAGRLDGSRDAARPDWAGFAIFAHPSGPGMTVRWCCTIQPFGMLAAGPNAGGPWVLNENEPVTMRYSVLVHAGSSDRNRMEAEYARFAR